VTSTPIIAAATLEEVVAWRGGHGVSAARFLAEVRRVADGLPQGRHVLNLCGDRYRFAVALCAAVLAGKISLLPPNHSPELIDRLRELYDDVYVISDSEQVQTGLRLTPYPQHLPEESDEGAVREVPAIDDEQVVAHVFTSGSTGLPTAHAKHWARLVYNVQSEAMRLGIGPGSAITLVGTVPPQHMYGFESTVMLALQNRIAFNGGSPFYPADIVAAIESIPGERILVTTPFHLRLLLDAALPLPKVRLLLSATAPLSLELAQAAEARFGAPLLEIYGCTEAGQLATRRPTHGEVWETFRGVTITHRGAGAAEQGGAAEGTASRVGSSTKGSESGGWFAQGGHIDTPTPLSDVLALESPSRFRLLGRDADMVNVAGKRTSLAHLNHLLCAIPGVVDGAFFNPEEGTREVSRLTAFVVTRTLTAQAILAQLRRKTDAVFLPRPLHLVEKLPRADTGKLPQAALAALARQCQSDKKESGRSALKAKR
jgi:acyl-coenzyme A synthetase/AMP-(fatty) acid ligase